MTNWSLIFSGVQEIVPSSLGLENGLNTILEFAKRHSDEYDEPTFWEQISSPELPLKTIVSWAVEGFENLKPYNEWSVLILDCGDCPDIFRLIEVHLVPEMTSEQFRNFASTDAVRAFGEFPEIFQTRYAPIFLTGHNIDELQHPILSWNNGNKGWDFHGSNGYLLWLGVATLALCEPLLNTEFCRRILNGRSEIILMSGFEEIFFYVGTISESGLAK